MTVTVALDELVGILGGSAIVVLVRGSAVAVASVVHGCESSNLEMPSRSMKGFADGGGRLWKIPNDEALSAADGVSTGDTL